MPCPEINSYITDRLESGDSPAEIALTLHAWGYRANNPQTKTAAAASRNTSSRIILNFVSIVLIFVVGAGAVWSLNSNASNSNQSAQNSTRQAQINLSEANSPVSKSSSPVLGAETNTKSLEPEVLTPSKEPKNDLEKKQESSANAAAEIESAASPDDLQTTQQEPSTTPLDEQSDNKSQYSIALVGDSMIDTLDSHLPLLKEKLSEQYDADFKIYNYGVGAETVETGLERFDQALEYKKRSYPPLSELQPDIIVIGSFAYNPFAAHDVNRYWLTMAQLIEQAQTTQADVYLLAEVAPVEEKFAVGSLDWTVEERCVHAQKIVDQFNSFTALSKSLDIPLIDVYSQTQEEEGFGSGEYTSDSDHIHANEEGKKLAINEIVKALDLE